MDRVIGIGEYIISNDIQDVLKTYALSSCVAITVYEPGKKVLGMVHVALPSSLGKLPAKPGLYADTAVPMLIDKMNRLYDCNKYKLEIKLFGGAQSIRKEDQFQIGKRNLGMIQSVLRKMNLTAFECDTGGHISRTITADVATGMVKVACQPLKI